MATLRSRFRRTFALLTLVSAAAGCQDSGASRILEIEATAPVFVLFFLDQNLNNLYEPAVDTQLEDKKMLLRMLGDTRNHETQTDTQGIARFFVPVGRYTAIPDSALLGDSLEVVATPPEIRVIATDTARELMVLGFLVRSIEEARQLPVGRKVWTYGIVHNPPFLFGDSTVHITLNGSSMRMTDIRPNVPLLPGDSAYFLGRIANRDGQPTMMVTSIVIRGTTTPPEPDTLTAAEAASADDGRLDAALVHVPGVEIVDTATVGLNRFLTVEDASGTTTVLLTGTINFGNPAILAPGLTIDVTGLLVPDAGNPGTWRIRPRGLFDLAIVP